MIVEHPKRRYEVEDTVGHGLPCLCVKCVYCGALSGTGPDIEAAVEAARRDGFSTMPGLNASRPRVWGCKKCVAERKKV